MTKVVVGLYERRDNARQVVDDLTDERFDRNQIRTIEKDGGNTISSLVSAGVPRDDAVYYDNTLRQGGSMVTVTTDDRHADEAVEIMQRYHPLNFGHRVEGQGRRTDIAAEEEETIPVVEEEVEVGKRRIQEGGVRIHTHVTETPVEETVTLRDEHVHVDRRQVDRPARPEDIDAFEDATLEVTETREEAVIQKMARVVEEVVVSKDVEEHQETVHDTVRRTDVDVEQIGGETAYRTPDFASYHDDFRTHYSTNYANSGYDYTIYEPAYQYGYTLGTRPALRQHDWATIEPEARRRWEAEHETPWDQVKDAVRHSWERMRH